MTRSDKVTMEQLLDELLRYGGTDLIISAGAAPFVRVDGVIYQMEGIDVLEPEDTERLVVSLLDDDVAKELDRHKEIDFSFSWRSHARLRANAFRQRGSVGLAVRLIPFEIPSMESLGVPLIIQSMLHMPRGLILVTGPTGAGKSTTLASMLDWINQNRAVHILTIEDPIEYVHHHKRSAVHQREIGTDSVSFTRALRSVLREDPDVLLVGEMRDLESIQSTLTIAETGHLVFATLHTNDTAQAIDRIIDVFPGDRQAQIRIQLANALQAVVYQELLPRIGGGRVAAFEVLLATYPIRNLIKEGKTRQIPNVVATSQRDGMQTYEAALESLVLAGIVSAEEASARLIDPARASHLNPSELGRLHPA
ncbi:MAG TPA: type IV pilus twitching motility protein PilT [Actinomycetota bacterium]